MNTTYQNKTFSILGDSISTFEGKSVPEYAAFYDLAHKLEADVFVPGDTWWGSVIDQLGGRLLVNQSIMGSTVCWSPQYEIQSYGCSEERTSSLGHAECDPDVILVYMGTNDWGKGTPLYDDSLQKSPEDTPSIFYPAYRLMIERLRDNYPDAEIWCFTLAKSCQTNSSDFVFPYCYRGRHIEEYCKVIRDLAAEYGCRLIDLYACAEPYDTIDGFHPNANGMQTIAKAVLQEISRF